MKIGVSSYSFGQYMRNTGADVFQIMDKAKELGFSSMEFTQVYEPEGTDPVEQAKKVRDYAEKLELPITAYTIGADFLKNDEVTQFELLKKQLAIAEALGATMMRHDITGGFPAEQTTKRGFENCVEIVAPRVRRVTEYAQTLGIRTMFENHGKFCQDSDRVEMLLNAVGHENFGLLLDVGNFSCADDDSGIATGKLAPYAFHVHLKDMFIKSGMMPDPGAGWMRTRGGNYLRCTVIGHGDIPVPQCIQILKNAGYKGNYSIEFEGIEENIFGLKTGLANLQHWFPED